jgi:hypothetical protein
VDEQNWLQVREYDLRNTPSEVHTQYSFEFRLRDGQLTRVSSVRESYHLTKRPVHVGSYELRGGIYYPGMGIYVEYADSEEHAREVAEAYVRGKES